MLRIVDVTGTSVVEVPFTRADEKTLIETKVNAVVLAADTWLVDCTDDELAVWDNEPDENPTADRLELGTAETTLLRVDDKITGPGPRDKVDNGSEDKMEAFVGEAIELVDNWLPPMEVEDDVSGVLGRIVETGDIWMLLDVRR